jgi:glucosamine--fructose-6-phosphate aminotransferase (isomerizing)
MNTSTAAPGALMAQEIDQQPETLTRLLEAGTPHIRDVVAQIRQADPRFVVLAARGTSDHAAVYAKYLIEVALGLPVGLASPSTTTVYDAPRVYDRVLWLAVSQSGGSPDLVASTRAAAAGGALTVSVTNAPDSPLAAATHHHVDILAGPERSVAATKTYTAQLLALWLIVDLWRGGDGRAAVELPSLARRVLDQEQVAALADRYLFASRLLTTGRGFSYPTALEASLKLMETSYVSAQAFSAADLLHGPIAMVDHDRPVLAFASRGRGGEAIRPVLEQLAERGADVCVIGDPAQALAPGRLVPLPTHVPEDLAPILEILPAQQLAQAMSVARRLDPDRPRGLAKVTETL